MTLTHHDSRDGHHDSRDGHHDSRDGHHDSRDGHHVRPSEQVMDEVLYSDEEVFKDFVDRDLRSDPDEAVELLAPPYRQALRSAEVCERWYQMLVRLKKSTELTIAAKKSDDKLYRIELIAGGNHKKADTERQRFLRWQAGALRFLTGVEIRMTEANYWRRVHATANSNDLHTQLRLYRKAIVEHRNDFLSNPDDEPSAADRVLWAILND